MEAKESGDAEDWYATFELNENGNGPESAREWSAFNRSFANKTVGLTDGKTRNIIIYTADHVFFVKANGYMSGTIYSKLSTDADPERVDDITRRFKMKVTRTEALLIEGFKRKGLGLDETIGLLLLLRSQEQQLELLRWMVENLRSTQQELMVKAWQIGGLSEKN